MKQEPNKYKCPKNFKLYAALVLGMGCMVITLAILDSLQRGRVGYDDGLLQHKLQPAAIISEVRENNPAETPWLGIEIQDIDETIAEQLDLRNSNGVLVSKVIQGSPADKSGIKRGDVIVRFDHRSIKDASFLQNLIAKLSVGERVQVVVVRNGDSKSLYVKIGVTPTSNANPASIGGEVLQWGIEVSPLTATLAQSFGITESKEGIVVVQIQPGAGAALAGLLPGDLILSVNSSPTPDMSTFLSAISSTQETVFDIVRGDENLYLAAYENDKPGYQGKPADVPGM
ncbi:hypothetical protein ES703_76064 [subsurface metagenome]